MHSVANSTPVLDVQDLVKRFRATTAVGGVSFQLQRGEHLGLLGPNGAGKSTLVKMVCGLIRPSAGSATVLGHRAGTRAARNEIGYLAELFRFPGWLTADEVLRLHQRLTCSPGGQRERGDLLDMVGLDDASLRKRTVDKFSKGMQQRLGIAQALVGDPRLVLLDEPTSALDPAGRLLVRELLDRLRERGVCVVLNSHLLGEVEHSCDQVLIMRSGRVVRRGAPSELTEARGVEVTLRSGVRVFETATRDDAPNIVRELVAAGEEVFEVAVRRSSLETAYLEAVSDSDDVKEPS